MWCYVLRCQPYRLQQQQHSRYCRQITGRNSTESRLFVVVDHHLDPWRCVGIVPAERYVKRVHAIFAPPAPHRSPHKARSGHTAVRARATFKAHTNKPRDTEKTFAQRQSTFRKRHSLKQRTAHFSRQRCTGQQKTTHHLYKEQPRHQSKQASRT